MGMRLLANSCTYTQEPLYSFEPLYLCIGVMMIIVIGLVASEFLAEGREPVTA